MRRHALLAIPFLVAVVVLVVQIPMPTQDPEIIPMPLEGAFIPTAEWFLLIFWVPFFHFSKEMAPWIGLVLPLVVFLLLTGMPFYFRPTDLDLRGGESEQVGWGRRVWGFSAVVLSVTLLFGSLSVATYRSPTLGCNSCHNVSMGERMGIPPAAFKDRNIVPLVADDAWMTKHWFIPAHVW